MDSNKKWRCKELDDKKADKIFYIITIFWLIYCLLYSFVFIIDYYHNATLFLGEILARKLAYCLWLNPSLKAVSYTVNSLLMLGIVIATSGLLSILVRKLDVSIRTIPFFLFVCFVNGSFLFSPHILAHYHFRETSTEYFFKNIVSGIGATAFCLCLNYCLIKRNVNLFSSIRLSSQIIIAFISIYLLSSFFYIFGLSGGIE